MKGRISIIKILSLNSLLLFFLFSFSNTLANPAPSKPNTLPDNKLHIYFCGTGDPDALMQNVRKPACLALMVNNELMLIDAGEGAVATLAALRLPYGKLSKIFVTHWHSDHFAGIPQVLNTSWYNAGRKKLIDVYGPEGIHQVMSGIARAYALDVKFRSSNQTINPKISGSRNHLITTDETGKEIYRNGDFILSAFQVDHRPVYPAFGYQINFRGCKIIVSGDTKIVDSLARHAENADVLINEVLSKKLHEENKSPDNPNVKAIEAYHSDSLELAKMAERVKVKRLYLTHFVPSIQSTPEAKQSFMTGMSDYYKGPITATDDRDELVIVSTGENDCKVTYVPRKALQLPLFH